MKAPENYCLDCHMRNTQDKKCPIVKSFGLISCAKLVGYRDGLKESELQIANLNLKIKKLQDAIYTASNLISDAHNKIYNGFMESKK
jgi:hypothetical protein